MIELSNRMEIMASFVEKGESVADIGTDHGLLPLALMERGKCPKVIMADVSGPSLEKARENYKEFFKDKDASSEGVFCFMFGDGLKVIEAGSVDAITIAGMGGRLITEILGADFNKTFSFKKFILQPRNGSHVLRQFLLKNNFIIDSEALVEEGKYICEIIVAKPIEQLDNCNEENNNTSKILENNKKTIWKLPEDEESIVWEFPITKKIDGEPLLQEFILRKKRKQEKILKKIIDTNNSEKTYKTKEKINQLEELIGERI